MCHRLTTQMSAVRRQENRPHCYLSLSQMHQTNCLQVCRQLHCCAKVPSTLPSEKKNAVQRRDTRNNLFTGFGTRIVLRKLFTPPTPDTSRSYLLCHLFSIFRRQAFPYFLNAFPGDIIICTTLVFNFVSFVK